MQTYRETMIRINGVERVIRTELGGKIRTVKQLEAAQLKAVKDGVVAMRQTKLDTQYDEMVTDAQAPQKDKKGWPGSGERTRQNLLDQAEIWRAKYGTAGPVRNVTTSYVNARKGFPKVTFTSTVPEYLIETAPGEYATPEAAKSMGATEHVDEIVPGLAIARYGKGWTLHHLPSVTDEQPNIHLGPVFKTRKRAREVVLTELARFDFTRSRAEIVADEETAAVVKLVIMREFVTSSKRNAWAEDDLRKAEEAVAALSLDVAA
ncbi:hypothetical protein M2271_003599 [Streptomyces sp. LBL]|uniref:hypothetical protein n=1 Tax=Streptomyces sp. LBL TaxID=2940562 RepID=UPI0024757984|nr:hypothetical protein [Streptomyces sp. LBL]MDH6625788.1 hypothetical protein [Streptomyces sp. LBL]